MLCEMCNKTEASAKALVEGAELALCRNCSRFGKIIGEIQRAPVKRKETAKPAATAFKAKPEIVETIVSDYADRIRRARERLGLMQKEFALKITEKESVVHKLETGELEPSVDLARKLERILKIKLVEALEESESINDAETKGSQRTIGDIWKLR